MLISVIMFSCGPQSGVHNDKAESEAWCGTESILSTLDSTCGDGYELFKPNCAVCHTTSDLKLTAVGLAGIASRLLTPPEDYFVKYTLNNEKVYLSGDAYAKKLKENNISPMPIFDSVLTEQNVKQIYKYLTSAITPQN